MQDVCADDEIERSFVEALLERFAIQIECPVFNFGELGQFLLGRGEERARGIGEDVAMQFALQTRKNIGGQTAGARADLENAQSATLR